MQKGRRVLNGPFSDSPVPEAMGRLLTMLEKRIGIPSMDRIWIFPPLVRGRKEWGLVAVSCLADGLSTSRTLVTGRYTAELTGTGIDFDAEFVTEGSVPPERLPHMMDGVVRRSDLSLGPPKEIRISGAAEAFRGLLSDFGVESGAHETVD